MEIKLKLTSAEHKDLVSYCNLNDKLISSVVKDSFTTGFNIERYGLLNSGVSQDKQVEKEVIVEKRVEIPVEVIKEVIQVEYVEVEKPVEVIKEVTVEKIVEVTKEIPVEKVVIQEIIKEVPVDKIVYVTDQQELNEKIFQKDQDFEEERKKFSTKIHELENIFQKEKQDLLVMIETLKLKEPEIKEVIKEVIIEKEGKSDEGKIDALQKTIYKLRQENMDKEKVINELSKTIEQIQLSQEDKKAVYLRGSNLDDKLYK